MTMDTCFAASDTATRATSTWSLHRMGYGDDGGAPSPGLLRTTPEGATRTTPEGADRTLP